MKGKVRSILIFVFLVNTLFSGVCYSENYSAFGSSEKFIREEFLDRLLKHSAQDDTFYEFYKLRDFKPIWYGDREKLSSLDKIIEISIDHGLPKTRYELSLDSVYLDKYQLSVVRKHH